MKIIYDVFKLAENPVYDFKTLNDQKQIYFNMNILQ